MISRKSLIYILLFGLMALALPGTSHAGVAVGISVRIGPPVLPVYVQPPCPEPGYIWTPGYWAYGPDGYYWVPGAWVEPPAVGVLWTPGYWGWSEGFYVWHGGYWGPHVGFYGGINYGFGYTGVGFVGGYWVGHEFRYNRAVTNVNVTVIHNTYINNTVVNRNVTRVSYNGGAGGIRAVPSERERNWEHERHFEATSAQSHHQELARGDRNQLYAMNHGNPHIAASPKAGVFEGRGVVGTRNNFNRGGNNNAGNFNHGNNTASRDFSRNNNSPRDNGSGFKGNGAQGGNFDRNARNNSYGNASHGSNPPVVNNRGNNSHPNYTRDSGGRSDQHANNTHGDKGDKHDHR